MTNDMFPMTVGGEDVSSERSLLAAVEDGTMMLGAESVRFIVIHCSATRADRDYTAEQLLSDHLARGFRTVGYHFYLRRSGELSQHRRLLEVGAHCRPYNRCSIGICYEGGLAPDGTPADTRTPQQREQLLLLLMRLKKLFPKAQIVGHRDLPSTLPKACPCFDAEAEYARIA